MSALLLDRQRVAYNASGFPDQIIIHKQNQRVYLYNMYTKRSHLFPCLGQHPRTTLAQYATSLSLGFVIKLP